MTAIPNPYFLFPPTPHNPEQEDRARPIVKSSSSSSSMGNLPSATVEYSFWLGPLDLLTVRVKDNPYADHVNVDIVAGRSVANGLALVKRRTQAVAKVCVTQWM